MNILISADSTCDLNERLLSEYHIALTPLYVNFDDDSKRDGVDCTAADILAFTERTGRLCTTAAVSIGDYGDFFGAMCRQFDAVIHFTISAEMSSCYQNACVAAEDYPDRVFVVDSRSVSAATGLQVIRAAQDRDRGLSAEEIRQRALARREKIHISFIPDTLDYLRKGGRCSALAALGANVLKLKPCIEAVDGRLEVRKKYRGTLSRVLKELVRDQLSEREDIRRDMILLPNNLSDSALSEAVCENIQAERIEFCPLGATVVSHCGPDTLGIVFEEN